MPDFLSASSFEGLTLPEDALSHRALAKNTLRWLVHMRPGSVLALQGSWGRGKTDVLARIMELTRLDPPPPCVAAQALWVNPWQYGSPDLLTPVVRQLAERAEQKGFDPVRLRQITAELIQAGTSFGLKAAGTVVPGGALLALAAPEASRLIAQLTAPGAPPPSGDPVASMAANFRELAEGLLSPEERQVGGRLVLLIDDLDRCLPDRQVALLQALRFLVSAGAPVSIVVALDPVLARQGVLAHYRSTAFDPDLYLDKMFDLRINLGPVESEALNAFIQVQLSRRVVVQNQERPLREVLPAGWAQLAVSAPSALKVQSLRNPRIVERVFDKVRLLASARRLPVLEQPGELKLALLYLVVAERWPSVRRALTEKGAHEGLERLAAHVAGQADPAFPDHDDFHRLFSDMPERQGSARVVFPRIEQVLVGAGF